MVDLKFADTHNLVAFLSKPTENKTINGEVQLHALVDGKKIIITESTVRRDLQLKDAVKVTNSLISIIEEIDQGVGLSTSGIRSVLWDTLILGKMEIRFWSINSIKMYVPSSSTTEEKICKKNDVKARSLLLMALPNEHQLTFNQYADAQSMLQKLVSRLAILGVDTPPEDLNVKFLRSLPSEWDTHVVVWMNKPDFETMGLDDLYNNFKIVEQKVKRTVAVNNDDKNLAFLTTSSPSSTNPINMLTGKGKEVLQMNWEGRIIIDGSLVLLDMTKIQRCFENRAMCAIDGGGFDWSDMADGCIQANNGPLTGILLILRYTRMLHSSCLGMHNSKIKMGLLMIAVVQDDGIDAHQVNTASPQVNTGSRDGKWNIPPLRELSLDYGTAPPSEASSKLAIYSGNHDTPRDGLGLGLWSNKQGCYTASVVHKTIMYSIIASQLPAHPRIINSYLVIDLPMA
ncbi:hypothetical protein Tco_0413395 [Tanacetum coccineum]